MNINIAKLFYISIIFIIILTNSVNAISTSYYVSIWGNNLNDGLSINSSFSTVKYAATKVNPGDTIFVVNGTYYNETNIKFKSSGIEGAPITLTAYNGTPMFIQAPSLICDNTKLFIDFWEYSYFNISNISLRNYPGFSNNIGNNTHLNNIDYRDFGGPITISQGIADGGSHHNSLRNSIISNTSKVCGWNSLQIQGMYGGQNAYASHDILVENNIIYGNTMHNLVDLMGYMYNITIKDNEIYDGTYQALFNHGSSDINQIMERIYFYNNTIHDLNGTAAVITLSYWHDSLIYNNTFYNIPSSVSLSSTTTDNKVYPDNLTIFNNTFTNVSEEATKMFLRSEGIYSINQSLQLISHFYNGTTLYYNNNIRKYSIGGEGIVTIRDNNINNYSIAVSGNGTAIVEDTGNKVFTVSTIANPLFYKNKSEIIYQMDKSNFSVQAKGTNIASFSITTYPMTARPTSDPATVTVNTFDTSLSAGKVLASFTANTTNGNTVAFTMSTLTPGKRYFVKVGGVTVDSPVADYTGMIEFSHSTWPAGTFTVVEDGSYIPSLSRGNAIGISTYVSQDPLPSANVTLYYQNGTSYGQSLLSGSDGSFIFSNIPYGNYYVAIDKQLYKENTSLIFNVNSTSTNIGTIKAMCYDVNGDTKIDVLDLNMILQSFNVKTGASYPSVDVNGDGVVDINDVTLVAGQIGE